MTALVSQVAGRRRMPVRSATAHRARLLGAIAVLLIPSVHPMRAQGRTPDRPTRPVTVSGVAFDSLRGSPLSGAFVFLMERSRNATSDERGRFQFDSVPPGTYTVALQHAALDSLGLPGATQRITVTDGRTPIVMGIPGFATLWSAACGAVPVPSRDTGLVYGSILDAQSREPIPDSWVVASWLDLVKLDPAKRSTNIMQRRWKSDAQADARGGYAVCGTPLMTEVTMRATFGPNTTGDLTLAPSRERVRRRDLVMSGRTAADTLRRGVVIGSITDAAGYPIPNARVTSNTGREALTDAKGLFTIPGIAAGTRQLEAVAIGASPVSVLVDVYADDTAHVQLAMPRAQRLDAVRVTSSAVKMQRLLQFEERRRAGYGAFLDSTAIGKRATMAAVFTALQGVTVENRSRNGRLFNLYLPSTGLGPCLAMVFIDGVQQFDHEMLGTFVPDDIAAVEVYQQRTTVPAELMRSDQKCGVVAVWTKRAWR